MRLNTDPLLNIYIYEKLFRFGQKKLKLVKLAIRLNDNRLKKKKKKEKENETPKVSHIP